MRAIQKANDEGDGCAHPLRFLVGMLQMFLASAALVGIVFIGMCVWLFNSHSYREDLTKNFSSEQGIYSVNLESGKGVRLSGTAYDKDTVAKAFDTSCDGYGDGRIMKGLKWTQDNWLSDKSDAYARAYITASHNLDALNYALYMASGRFQTHFVIPKVRVIEISFLQRTDEEMRSPANAHYNWFTGICEVGHCSKEDFVPATTRSLPMRLHRR